MIESLVFVAAALSGPQDIPDSQYRGYHYEAQFEPVRKCLIWRESRGRKSADGSGGSGLYQFIQSTWDTQAVRAGYPEWVGVRPYKAPRYVQDEVFWVTVNPKPKLKGLHGKHHWSVEHANVRIGDCFNE